MANILLAGGTGLLGCSLLPYLKEQGHQVWQQGYRQQADVSADLCNKEQVIALLDSLQPDCIINLAALTNVDYCEEHPQQAYLLNTAVVENMAAWIKKNAAAHLIHISTDQLYDGSGPHREAEIQLQNYYSFSKKASEIAAGSVDATVLRTNFFGRSQCAGRASFSDWLFGALQTQQSISVFDDVLFSPLSIQTLTRHIALLVQKKPAGVFNLGSKQGMSKADFAFIFAKINGFSTAGLNRTTSAAADFLKARRPKDMRMDCRLYEKTMALQLPDLIDEITIASQEYN
jgi:dTDP-4-dehydrorhamnose reductase